MLRKLLTGTLIGGGLIACYSFVTRMKRMKAELEAEPKASIYKADLTGITIRLDLVLKNPTKGSFSLKFPFIKLTYKGAAIGSSQVIDKDITLPAFGQATIDKILVDLPMQSIFSVSTSILNAVEKKEAVKIEATIISTISIGPVNIPYEEKRELTIKP